MLVFKLIEPVSLDMTIGEKEVAAAAIAEHGKSFSTLALHFLAWKTSTTPYFRSHFFPANAQSPRDPSITDACPLPNHFADPQHGLQGFRSVSE